METRSKSRAGQKNEITGGVSSILVSKPRQEAGHKRRRDSRPSVRKQEQFAKQQSRPRPRSRSRSQSRSRLQSRSKSHSSSRRSPSLRESESAAVKGGFDLSSLIPSNSMVKKAQSFFDTASKTDLKTAILSASADASNHATAQLQQSSTRSKTATAFGAGNTQVVPGIQLKHVGPIADALSSFTRWSEKLLRDKADTAAAAAAASKSAFKSQSSSQSTSAEEQAGEQDVAATSTSTSTTTADANV